ncbi:hypothetical protein [Anatilimnocola floriformis]|uniref:hypothetical protein n=1 Tax=Anatilimnocola floriformis TaxID=2948575 RepID=UPI0020C336FA|nr:hypothetical protein [Anatilimnocola floriformis]
MKWDANTSLSLAACVMAGIALSISLVSAFPGLKGLIGVVRDSVLWLAVLVLLGGAGFVVYQRLQQSPALSQRSAFDDLPGRAPAPRPFIPGVQNP